MSLAAPLFDGGAFVAREDDRCRSGGRRSVRTKRFVAAFNPPTMSRSFFRCCCRLVRSSETTTITGPRPADFPRLAYGTARKKSATDRRKQKFDRQPKTMTVEEGPYVSSIVVRRTRFEYVERVLYHPRDGVVLFARGWRINRRARKRARRRTEEWGGGGVRTE